jgi:predicted RecB family nuclease
MVTNDIFTSHLNCRRKAYLKAAGLSGEPHDFEVVQLGLDRAYRARALAAFLDPRAEDGVIRAPASLEAVLRERPHVIVNAAAEADGIRSHIHALERTEQTSERTAPIYAPVLFVRNEKITHEDKLLLAFNALVLSALQGQHPAVAKIVHGTGHKILRVKLEPFLAQARKVLGEIRASQAEPRATLNGHCNVCEFRNPCRQEAEKTDDLSLLRGMSEKELEKHHKRGITTVTQLSHAYQPGRRGKRTTGKARKHDHALQALAIREKKVYVLDSPVVLKGGVALYLDIEGIPDLGFEYLFGLLAVKDGVCTEHSFWADDPSQEKVAWADCMRVIEGFGDCTLYHYGQYESRFLERMKREAASKEEAAAVARIQARSCNVLAAIYSHVYFPTWSNSLKDVGTFLGARWSAFNASGAQSLAWRLAWEAGRDEATRHLLLTYNHEDCLALRRVTEFVLSICGDRASMPDSVGPAVASVEDLHQASSFRFGKTPFFCPDLAHINKCAYADYQRDKVYLRTDLAMRRSLRRKERIKKKRLPVNQDIECGRPELCPKCGGKHLYCKGQRLYPKIVSDIKITPAGIKRWVVRYNSLSYTCCDCRSTIFGDAYRKVGPQSRLGENLASWTVYNHVALRLSHEDIILRGTNRMSFGTPLAA